MSRVHLFYHPDLRLYDFGEGHPFRGDRFAKLVEHMKRYGLDEMVDFKKPLEANDEILKLVHSSEYLETVKQAEAHGRYLTMDTPVMPGAMQGARLIAGSGIAAADSLLDDECDIAVTLGGLHHAGVSGGEGFCLVNDVAITAKYLIEKKGLERVLILDTDAHQGNGTMDIFYSEPRVLFISLHQDPRWLYPGKGFIHEIGVGDGRGRTINVPMPVYSTDSHYRRALNEICTPVIEEFQPQILIRNGGSDPHIQDILTNLGMDFPGLKMLGEYASNMSEKLEVKHIDMIASGYGKLVNEGWLSLLCGVIGAEIPKDILELDKPFPHDMEILDSKLDEVIKKAREFLKPYWNCF